MPNIIFKTNKIGRVHLNSHFLNLFHIRLDRKRIFRFISFQRFRRNCRVIQKASTQTIFISMLNNRPKMVRRAIPFRLAKLSHDITNIYFKS